MSGGFTRRVRAPDARGKDAENRRHRRGPASSHDRSDRNRRKIPAHEKSRAQQRRERVAGEGGDSHQRNGKGVSKYGRPWAAWTGTSADVVSHHVLPELSREVRGKYPAPTSLGKPDVG